MVPMPSHISDRSQVSTVEFRGASGRCTGYPHLLVMFWVSKIESRQVALAQPVLMTSGIVLDGCGTGAGSEGGKSKRFGHGARTNRLHAQALPSFRKPGPYKSFPQFEAPQFSISKLRNYCFPDLLGRDTTLLKPISHKCLLDAGSASSCVIILKTTMEAFVMQTAIAVTITGHLCNQLRSFSSDLISFPRLAIEFLRWQRRSKSG